MPFAFNHDDFYRKKGSRVPGEILRARDSSVFQSHDPGVSRSRESRKSYSLPFLAALRSAEEGRENARIHELSLFKLLSLFLIFCVNKFIPIPCQAIPRKFIRKYGNYLSNRVLLKAPSGESFEVALEVFEGRVWLGNGWRKFQEYYSLVMGSFILFELEGNDALNVLIFDLSGTETDYVVEDSYQPVETQQTGDSSPVESTDASEPEPKGRQFKGRSRHKPTDPQSESESSGLRKRTSRPRKRANISHTTRSLAGNNFTDPSISWFCILVRGFECCLLFGHGQLVFSCSCR